MGNEKFSPLGGLAEEDAHSEDIYERLFTEMDSGCALHEVVCSEDGTPEDYVFLEINPAFERLTGLRRDNLIGRTVLEALPDTEMEWIQRYGEVALSGKSIQFEQYSQELRRWYRVRAFSPRHMQFAVVFTEITQLKEAADILDAIPAGVFVYTFIKPDQLYLESSNPEAVRLTGVDAGIWKGREFDEIWPGAGELKHKFLQPFSCDRYLDEDDIPYELDGDMRFYRVRTFLLPGEKLAVAFEDVTMRHRAEDELAKIFTMSRDLICVADITSGTFLKINPAFSRTLGYSEEYLLGRPFLEFIHPDDVDSTVEVLERELQSGKEVIGFQNRYRTQDGSYRILEWESHPIPSEGRTYAIARDVTDRKRAEEVMIQNEKMISVGGLAAGMAHEINNPLCGILGGVQNCLRRLSPTLPANVEEARKLGLDMELMQEYLEHRGILKFLEGIRETGNRASRIVRNMLGFSRASESSPVPWDIGLLLDKAVELASSDYDLKKKFDFRKIEIIRQYESALPKVMVYETRMEQVFLNLLRNAAQAMSEIDDVGYSPSLTLSTALAYDGVEVSIADNGPGMDEETRKRALDPFFTTKEPGMGTGLGLSVSYFIITENHGGSFEVKSEPGEGATFIVRIPISQP